VKAPALLFLLLSFLLPLESSGQRAGFPNPPPSMNSQGTPPAPPTTVTRPMDFAELQKEADELARTAQTIPDDVAALRKGTLPKDLLQKLKHIEKLSKRLRSQVSP
jgi:hypothetical protein